MTYQGSQQVFQRNSARPKGATVGRNQNRSAVSAKKNVGVRANANVEDEFEKDMDDFVDKLMSGVATPLQGGETKKLKEDYEEAVEKYIKETDAEDSTEQSSTTTATGGDASSKGAKKVGFDFNFEILTSDRRNTSQSMRQVALDRIIEGLASKYDPVLFSLNNLEVLTKCFTSGRTTQEIAQAFRAIALVSALELDDATEFLNESVLPHALSIIKHDERDQNLRASLITTYAIVQTFISFGSQGFGLDERATDLLDIANKYFSSDKSSYLCASAISAFGLLLLNIPSCNHLIEETLPEVVEFLKSDNVDIVNAAGKLVALMYELYDFTDQIEDADFEDTSLPGNDGYRFCVPTVENSDLFDLINRLTKSASERHVTKEGKSERRSVFRKILSFLEVRLQIIDPKNALTEEGRELALDSSIAQVRLSRTKSFPILTWSQLSLYQGLKWLYGSFVSTQLASNPAVKELVDGAGPPDTFGFESSSKGFDEDQEGSYYSNQDRGQKSSKKSSIQQQRDNKQKMMNGDF